MYIMVYRSVLVLETWDEENLFLRLALQLKEWLSPSKQPVFLQHITALAVGLLP